MEILNTIAEMRARVRAQMLAQTRAAIRATPTRAPAGLGLVPTMGALHAGHLSLVSAARNDCDLVAVSIFVNPTQFAPNEDFARYPRTFDADCALLEDAGVDLIFAPSVEEMYPRTTPDGPTGAGTSVLVEGVSDRLDGASRPGHFRGVTTVVSKLFNIVAPDRAYFGQKDAAQVAVLRQMVRDLNFDLELVVCPIVRDSDGLALSSRNQYLSAEQRSQALILRRALLRVESLVAAGESATATLLAEARAVLNQEPAIRLDYLAAVDPDTLLDVSTIHKTTLVAIAAYAGPTRLIDNILLGPR
ncbi:MAG TPA: pantoate--beta-alanine ligase [Acidisarcina sp.]